MARTDGANMQIVSLFEEDMIKSKEHQTPKGRVLKIQVYQNIKDSTFFRKISVHSSLIFLGQNSTYYLPLEIPSMAHRFRSNKDHYLGWVLRMAWKSVPRLHKTCCKTSTKDFRKSIIEWLARKPLLTKSGLEVMNKS